MQKAMKHSSYSNIDSSVWSKASVSSDFHIVEESNKYRFSELRAAQFPLHEFTRKKVGQDV
jgi:hypothetical protein